MSKHPPMLVKGETVPFINFDRKYYQCKAINVWGVSGTGKSYITNDLISSLAGAVHCLYIISTTAESDREFPMEKYTSPALIYKKLDMNIVDKIVSAAEIRTEAYNNIIQPKLLYKCLQVCKQIYKDCKSGKILLTEQDMKKFTRYDKMATKTIRFIKKRMKDLKNIEDKKEGIAIEDRIIEVALVPLKKISLLILDGKQKINPDDYPKEAMLTLSACCINPRICIVFNDVGSELKSLPNKEKTRFEDLYTRGRHAKMTIIFLAQDKTHVPKTARGNAHVNIFSDPSTMEIIMSEIASKTDLRRSRDIGAKIFGADQGLDESNKKHFKLIYFKDKSKFCYIQADKMGKQVRVGKKRLLDYLDKVEKNKKQELFQSMNFN